MTNVRHIPTNATQIVDVGKAEVQSNYQALLLWYHIGKVGAKLVTNISLFNYFTHVGAEGQNASTQLLKQSTYFWQNLLKMCVQAEGWFALLVALAEGGRHHYWARPSQQRLGHQLLGAGDNPTLIPSIQFAQTTVQPQPAVLEALVSVTLDGERLVAHLAVMEGQRQVAEGVQI